MVLYNSPDLQIIVEPKSCSSKPYILCYHLMALLYSLLHLCSQHSALGVHMVLRLPGLTQDLPGSFGTEGANRSGPWVSFWTSKYSWSPKTGNLLA